MARFRRTSAGASRRTHLPHPLTLMSLVSIRQVLAVFDVRVVLTSLVRLHDAQCLVQCEVLE